jgi:hypothetical protein
MPTEDGVRGSRDENAQAQTMATLEQLPYASTNWIRFEGSPRRTVRRWPLSPLPGLP